MPKTAFAGFDKSLFSFLDDLAKNNQREWFQENKHRYEADVLEPSLAFIGAFESRLRKISPVFQAVPKKSGGSLMRVYRDTRFSKDKTPYKTNVGIQFRHEMGRDVHAPGFYVHIEPTECFLGAGVWHPDSDALRRIRTAIDEDPVRWKRARDNKKFRAEFQLEGDALSNPPRGFEKDHPCIDDLKRKDFIAVKRLTRKEVLADSFIADVAASFAASKPLVRFICEAQKIPF